MIDLFSGTLKFDNNLEIAPSDRIEKYMRDMEHRASNIRDMRNGYSWLDIRNLKSEELFFIVSICFYQDRLSMVSMIFSEWPYADTYQGWGGYGLQEEKRNLQTYEKWLNTKLGNQKDFEWGSACAVMDPWPNTAAIHFNYQISLTTSFAHVD